MAKVYDTATDLITFARSSSATYLDSDGVLKTAATDAPRIEYAEDGTLKGLLIEEQRTNLLHNTDNPPTQVANLTAGSHTLSFVGGPSTQTISDSITANAVDVFVYDTKRDSDGGAWRTGSLAQASSWYNETLNTSTRGSRKEFPAVAVIVAESNKVTIYDGDDPSLPMWMVFNLGLSNGFWASTAPATSVAMRGATLVVGSISVGHRQVNFVSEKFVRSFTSSNGGQTGGIINRNATLVAGPADGPIIVNSEVNDVAMTVLPDAPTDPATGLPVPTIAVATQGGVSVITDSGDVYDDAGGAAKAVHINDAGTLFYSETNSTFMRFKRNIGTLSADFSSDGDYSPATTPSILCQTLDDQRFAGDASTSGDIGLSHLAEDPTTKANGMVAYTTSTYTTGWMNGDIKLAALANSATADRSVNNKPLTQYGTITATPVATGADVVAYSGFSSSAYLEQPYNSDLNFGTGDFCVMGWVTYKSGANNFIIDRTNGAASSTDRWNFGMNASGLFQRCDSTSISISHTFVDGVRYFICGVRTGGVFYAYVDGALVGSAAQAGDQTDSSQSYPLTVASFGGSSKGEAPTDIALIRISGTAPTADQIAKIYNDEKLLFQPNAKATLDGTSDAVTALAHDPETGLLHVGTSQSRSVFYGLRRINETGNAVTTAISAVDGLISEQ